MDNGEFIEAVASKRWTGAKEQRYIIDWAD